VRVGAIIPNAGPLPGELGVVAMARAAEAAGAESLWVSDHLLMVDADTTDYPYSADGRPTWSADTPYYEALACCSFIAAATSGCTVGTAVLVLPQRSVLEFAKTAATIDRLSGGRLALGVGAGWYAAELQALGYDPATRGRRFDEMLRVLRDAWTGRPEPLDGAELSIPPGIVLEPRPSRPGGPPLLVGGMGRRALRRAATLGDGWMAIGFLDRFDPDGLARGLATVRELRAGAGGGPLANVLKLHCTPELAGGIPDAVREVERIGFDEVIVEAPWAHGVEAAGRTIAAACHAVAART
jgi:probable F420-dependent oxidoreductase